MERVGGGWALVSAAMMLGILIVATDPEAARRRCALPSFREAASSARALVGVELVVVGVVSAMAEKALMRGSCAAFERFRFCSWDLRYGDVLMRYWDADIVQI